MQYFSYLGLRKVKTICDTFTVNWMQSENSVWNNQWGKILNKKFKSATLHRFKLIELGSYAPIVIYGLMLFICKILSI